MSAVGVVIPIDSLAPDTLRRVVEEFVSREATDYGYEVPFERKVDEVVAQLRRGEAELRYDEALQTTQIVATDPGRR